MKTIRLGILATLLWSAGSAADDRAATFAAVEAKRAGEARAQQEPLAREVEAMLGDDTKLTLYSVKPTSEFDWMAQGKRNGVDIFRSHPVRGYAAITDKAEIRELLQALIKGMRDSDGAIASCFLPHHGLTIEHAGKKVDLLICFSCLFGESYGAYSANGFPISEKPLAVFNEALARHRLPLPE